jgi:hypothetical protein
MMRLSLIILFSALTLSIFSLNSLIPGIFAQTANNTASMSGMSGDSGHGGGSSGMSSTPGMQHESGSIKEICSNMDDMPPHYCEPSYSVMSSIMGIKVSKITPLYENVLQVEITNLGNSSSIVDKEIIVIGGGGDLSGGSIIDSGWKNSTVTQLVFEGSGTIYSTPSISVHLFPLTNDN